jgi:hypothetical protein
MDFVRRNFFQKPYLNRNPIDNKSKSESIKNHCGLKKIIENVRRISNKKCDTISGLIAIKCDDSSIKSVV